MDVACADIAGGAAGREQRRVRGFVRQAGGSAGAGSPAVLYALNAMTGKELWNSGTTLKSYMPGRALWTSNSQVYVGGNDGAVYAFGFPLERK